MVEKSPRWQAGQEVSWPKVAPYTIARLVGEAGNIHITPKGRYHVYWHRELSDGTSILVHHGGPPGFDTLKAVMHQHERVILGYTGLTIQLPLDQTAEIPIEEEKERIPGSGFTFPKLIGRMQVELPGEQQVLGRWIGVLQDANRDLPQARSHGQLSVIRENLAKVGTDLSKAINPYKRAAAHHLETGLAGSKSQLLSGLNEAQVLLLKRAQQTVSIMVGTMQRYNALEKLQIEWNGSVNNLPFVAAEVLLKLQSPSFIDDGSLDKPIHALQARLSRLQGEPYFSKAQQFIASFNPLIRLWEQQDYQQILKVLTLQTAELEIWKRRVREESTGLDFGKYSLR